MSGLQEALSRELSRERSEQWRREAARGRVSRQAARSRRWRRRAEQARRRADGFEARAADAARHEYELAGH